MTLDKIIESGIPEDAPDALASVEKYPHWEKGSPTKSGPRGFIYFVRKYTKKPLMGVKVYNIAGWFVIFAKNSFSPRLCEQMQLRPGNGYTLGDMALQWACGAKGIVVTTDDQKMTGLLSGDPSKPDQYRFTIFDAGGAVGHLEGKEPRDLFYRAWLDGFRVLSQGGPGLCEL